MGFTVCEDMCRVDIFKDTGKWCSTEAVQFQDWHRPLIHDEFLEALDRAGVTERYGVGYVAVCLEPYHENAHPLRVKL